MKKEPSFRGSLEDPVQEKVELNKLSFFCEISLVTSDLSLSIALLCYGVLERSLSTTQTHTFRTHSYAALGHVLFTSCVFTRSVSTTFSILSMWSTTLSPNPERSLSWPLVGTREPSPVSIRRQKRADLYVYKSRAPYLHPSNYPSSQRTRANDERLLPQSRYKRLSPALLRVTTRAPLFAPLFSQLRTAPVCVIPHSGIAPDVSSHEERKKARSA